MKEPGFRRDYADTHNHPVGVPYDECVSRKPGGYRARGAVDPNIRFSEGKVSCVSCHALKPGVDVALDSLHTNAAVAAWTAQIPGCWASGATTVSSRRSQLCLSCHQM
jgi:hypothetical protein